MLRNRAYDAYKNDHDGTLTAASVLQSLTNAVNFNESNNYFVLYQFKLLPFHNFNTVNLIILTFTIEFSRQFSSISCFLLE